MLDAFREAVAVDFESVCLVAHELRSGRRFRLWRDELGSAPPYSTGPDVLFVAFYASAELGCYRVLGWPMPERILDLFTEFRDRTNGLPTVAGASLLGALVHFGLDGMGATEKEDMRALILAGGPWSDDERTAISNYCAGDVAALERLLPAMLPRIDLPRALLRGRYMAAAAVMEHNGTPIDAETLESLRLNWEGMQDRLIAEIDKDYGVYDGRTFKIDRFAALLAAHGIPWPRTESGRLALDDDTFRQQAKAHPVLSPLRELRSALSDLRLNDLAVGEDHRNRTILSAFRSRTGRNQPSNTKSIFGPSVWLRELIKPPLGYGIAYIDWSQQEFGIAAALSGDAAMQAAYLSGDPYLAFAKQAGAVPDGATKASHGAQRELFKQCVLAVQYGMEAESLALRIGQPPIVARDLLRSHHEVFRPFWRYSDAAVDCAMLHGSIHTVFGWHVHVGESPNPRSLRNFPVQANGSEMLRIACCLATERGIEVCAPVHDAVLICSPLERLEADIATTRAAMAEASRAVLAGFELRTDVSTTRYPDRYMDPLRCGHVGSGDQIVERTDFEENSVTDDPFDLEKLRLPPGQAHEKWVEVPVKIQKRRRHFVKVPWTWVERLKNATGQTYRVAIYLLYLHWKGKGDPIKLANGMLKIDGVPPQTKRRALRDLERRGLITVEWQPRKSPIVKLLK